MKKGAYQGMEDMPNNLNPVLVQSRVYGGYKSCVTHSKFGDDKNSWLDCHDSAIKEPNMEHAAIFKHGKHNDAIDHLKVNVIPKC